MAITARLKSIRIATRKVKMMADLVRGKSAVEAQTILSFKSNRSAEPMLKLLNSAMANAKHNFKLDPSTLYISKLLVDQGPTLKRSMPRSRGSAFPILKRTSHVLLELSPVAPKAKDEKKKKSAVKATKVKKEIK